MKKEILMIMAAFIIGVVIGGAYEVYAASQITDNGDGTYDLCWVDVPQSVVLRHANAFADVYGNRYYNSSQIESGLSNAQKLIVFKKTTNGFWGEVTYANEKKQAEISALENFSNSFETVNME